MKEEDESLQNRKPPAPERHRKVKRWIEERAVALRVQQELAEAKQIQLISVEAGLRMAEAELDYLADEKQARGYPCPGTESKLRQINNCLLGYSGDSWVHQLSCSIFLFVKS